MQRLKKIRIPVLLEDEKAAKAEYDNLAGKAMLQIEAVIALVATFGDDKKLFGHGLTDANVTLIRNQWNLAKRELEPIAQAMKKTQERAKVVFRKHPDLANEMIADAVEAAVVPLTKCAKTLQGVVSSLKDSQDFLTQLEPHKDNSRAGMARVSFDKSQPYSLPNAIAQVFRMLLHWRAACALLTDLPQQVFRVWLSRPQAGGAAKAGALRVLDATPIAELRAVEALLQSVLEEIKALADQGAVGKEAFELAAAYVKASLEKAEKVDLPIIFSDGQIVATDRQGELRARRRRAVEQMVHRHMKKLGLLPTAKD